MHIVCILQHGSMLSYHICCQMRLDCLQVCGLRLDGICWLDVANWKWSSCSSGLRAQQWLDDAHFSPDMVMLLEEAMSQTL